MVIYSLLYFNRMKQFYHQLMLLYLLLLLLFKKQILFLGNGKESSNNLSTNSVCGNGNVSSGSGNKVFPRLQKVASVGSTGGSAVIMRQDTIEELVEVEDNKVLTLRPGSVVSLAPKIVKSDVRSTPDIKRVKSFDNGSITSTEKENGCVENDQPPTASTTTTTSTTTTISALPSQIVFPNAEYKEIMSNIMNFKVDVKLEVQRLNQKIGRLEDLISDLVLKLSDENTVREIKERKIESDGNEVYNSNGEQQQKTFGGVLLKPSCMGETSSMSAGKSDR